MDIVLVHNHFEQGHLDVVAKQMESMGAPTIKAVHIDGDLYVALEGCHRLRAAEALGLEPEVDVIEYSEETLVCDLGLDFDPLDKLTVSDIVDGYDIRKTVSF